MLNTEQINGLKKFLVLSMKQKGLIDDGRLDEAVGLFGEREEIIQSLKNDDIKLSADDTEAREYLDKILENDKSITMKATLDANEITEKLKKSVDTKVAIKAYDKGSQTG